MRPPILKVWRRHTIDYRGIYVNRSGIGSQSPGGENGPPPAQGDNYGFVKVDNVWYFTLRDEAGIYYTPYVEGEDNAGSILLALITPDTFPIWPSATGNNYQFTRDIALRIVNINFATRWHTIRASANNDETLTIDNDVITDIYVAISVGAYHAFLTLNGIKSFYYKTGWGGALYKPWVIDNGGGIYTLELTAV